MKTVMCFGTFDILHPGHLNYFKQARRHGDYLMVVIARDATKHDQQKETLHSEQERLRQVQNIPIVNQAVLGNVGNHLLIIQKLRPDVLCLGYDHPISVPELRRKLAGMGLHPRILRMRPYHAETYKSTLIKAKIGSFSNLLIPVP